MPRPKPHDDEYGAEYRYRVKLAGQASCKFFDEERRIVPIKEKKRGR